MKNSPDGDEGRTTRMLRILLIISGAGALILGMAGIIGLVFGITTLTSVLPGYRPIALSASLVWSLFGLILLLCTRRPFNRTGKILLGAVTAVIAIAAALEFPLGLLNRHSLVETFINSSAAPFVPSALVPISPLAALLILPAAVGLFLLVLTGEDARGNWYEYTILGIFGVVCSLSGFILVASYIFGFPFFTGTSILPIAFPSALAGIFVGTGMTAAAGTEVFPLMYFSGASTRARLLRFFVPFTIALVLIQSLLSVFLISIFHIQQAIELGITLVLFCILASWGATLVAGNVGEIIDREQKLRKQAEEEQAKLSWQRELALTAAHLGWWQYDTETKVITCDRRFGEIFGIFGDEHPGEQILVLIHPDDRDRVRTSLGSSLNLSDPRMDSIDYRIISPDGGMRRVRSTGITIADGTDSSGRRAPVFIGTVEDITERWRTEQGQVLMGRIYQHSFLSGSLQELLGNYISEFQTVSGCEAIGIRLLDSDGNIPYQAYTGFPKEFYEQETPLSIKSDECMCIYVIKGCMNPGLPIATPGGSFYCNATSKFLATVSDEEKGRTRNVCNMMGYESVALIPLRTPGGIIGLIQLNDRHENKVPLELVRLLEDLSPLLGETILTKQAEAALRDSQAKLAAALSSMTDAVFISDTEGKFIEFNNAFATFHRFKNKAECKTTLAEYPDFLEVFMPDGTPAPLDRWAVPRALRGETGTNVEYTLRRKDTKETWVGSYSFAPIRDVTGRIVGSVVTGRDITTAKKAEQELREKHAELHAAYEQLTSAEEELRQNYEELTSTEEELRQNYEQLEAGEKIVRSSEQRLRRFYESGLFGVIFWNTEGKITDANDKFLSLTGYTREDLVAGRIDWGAMTPPEYQEQDAQSLVELQSTGVNRVPFEKEYFRKDGSRIPILIAGAMLDDRFLDGVAFVLDISERKAAETALRASEEQYRSLFENMQEGLAYCRMTYNDAGEPADFEYLAVNKSFDRIVGVGTVIGKPVTEIFPGIREAFPQMFEIYGRVARTGNPESFDLDFSPVKRWLHLSVYSPARDHFVAIFTDITDRKHAEEALRESEERFHQFFEKNNAVMLMLDPESGRILDVNPAASEFYGYSREVLCAMDIKEINTLPAEEVARLRGRVADGFLQYFVAPHRIADGSIRMVEIHSSPISVGSRTYLFSIIHDVTDREAGKAALATSEQRLRLAQDAANAGTWEWDLATNRNYWSDKVWELYGLSPSVPASYEAWLGVIIPEDRDVVARSVQEAARQGLPLHMEWRVNIPAQGIRWLMARGQPVMDEKGTVIRYLGIVIDITERKKIEAELEELALQRQLALNAARLGWWHFDPASKITTFDERHAEIFGISGFERTSEELFKFLDPADLSRIRAAFEAALDPANPRPYTAIEYRMNRPDGGMRWLRANGVASFEGEGELRHATSFVGTVEDITENKLAESQREALIRDLEQKNAELERFTYTVSHDLKSPLITIRGFAGFMEEDLHKNDVKGIHRDLDRITAATEKMEILLQDLLNLSRIGRIVNPPSKVPFAEIAREAVELLDAQLRNRRVQVTIDPEMPSVNVDRIRIREVLTNLIENAIKFMGDQRQPSISIGAQNDGSGRIEFFVRDNGIGIDARYHNRIFNLFEKLDAQKEGSGAGLAIVRRIIEVQGGKIRVESEGEGKGCTFLFTLPLAQTEGTDTHNKGKERE